MMDEMTTSIPSAVELVESFRQQVERTLEHAEKRLSGAKAELEFATEKHRQALLLKKSLDNALVENVMEQDR